MALSSNNGSTWAILGSNLTNTSFTLNTNNLLNSPSYKIKIEANDGQGSLATYILSSSFSIDNVINSNTTESSSTNDRKANTSPSFTILALLGVFLAIAFSKHSKK